ncbi:peptide deformylase [Nonomuraea turcica]|uniref:peptide deformylase n=1 Tax=Nonomuraea sp. G32 TaxID=3067274 RepID=UPI00273AC1B1|nr:peptide deformylase [Nonomuraea sp. G32]MDP4510349.1 peptide deformylase [Nonomuraea sp. G32]
MTEQLRPSQLMQDLGVIQAGDDVLARPARPFDLPAEQHTAQHILDRLNDALDRIGNVHDFSKGMGLAAPQLGMSRAAAIVRPPDAGPVILLNPRVTAASADLDEQYEGCLSFFDVRGMVPRSRHITVRHTTLDGLICTSDFNLGLARLIAHEIDHVNGVLYTQRMRSGLTLIPVAEYRGTGQAWVY